MRVGILGGSFNPPHRGHLSLAQTVLELELVDSVILVPAAVPPHKKTPEQADAETRLAMTRLLAAEDPRLTTDDLELHRDGPSFTIDTVRALAARKPDDSFHLVIGSDMAKSFASWRSYKELLQLCPPLTAERPDDRFHPGSVGEYVNMSAEEAAIMEKGRFFMPYVDISSTLIRKRLAEGADDAEMLTYLTGEVLRYIRHHSLYVQA